MIDGCDLVAALDRCVLTCDSIFFLLFLFGISEKGEGDFWTSTGK